MAEPRIPPDVAQRAVEWLVELQAPSLADGVHEQWRQWRAADPVHDQAWRHIEAFNGRLAGLAAPSTLTVAQAALAPRGSVRRRHAIQVLAVALFAGGAAWSGYDRLGGRAVWADARTGAGERRTLTLDDGTRVVLNTSSALDIHYGAQERLLRLVAGEVLIESGHDVQGRPLRIETPQGRATALGTRFSVRLLGDGRTHIGVFDGAVRIQPREGDASSVLQAGQQSHFGTATIAPPQPVREDSATAWVDGVLLARDMRLADFLAELGRYSVHPLSCDAEVADLRVSGVYPLADVDKVLENLSALLSLEIRTVTRFWGYQVVRVSLAPRDAPIGR